MVPSIATDVVVVGGGDSAAEERFHTFPFESRLDPSSHTRLSNAADQGLPTKRSRWPGIPHLRNSDEKGFTVQ